MDASTNWLDSLPTLNVDDLPSLYPDAAAVRRTAKGHNRGK